MQGQSAASIRSEVYLISRAEGVAWIGHPGVAADQHVGYPGSAWRTKLSGWGLSALSLAEGEAGQDGTGREDGGGPSHDSPRASQTPKRNRQQGGASAKASTTTKPLTFELSKRGT